MRQSQVAKFPQFVMLSGPSCAGKTPLRRALRRLHPALANALTNLVLYNSRERRPNERDGVEYHFRTRAEVEELARREGVVPIRVRNDFQALDLTDLQSILTAGKTAFWEGNPAVIEALAGAGALSGVNTLRVFLSPLASDEVRELTASERGVDPRAFVTDLSRRRLLRRTQKQRQALSAADLHDLEVRASTAYDELRVAWQFDAVLPNHDGEDSENWDALPYPLGDALRATAAFAALLRGEDHPAVEHWEHDLVP